MFILPSSLHSLSFLLLILVSPPLSLSESFSSPCSSLFCCHLPSPQAHSSLNELSFPLAQTALPPSFLSLSSSCHGVEIIKKKLTCLSLALHSPSFLCCGPSTKTHYAHMHTHTHTHKLVLIEDKVGTVPLRELLYG